MKVFIAQNCLSSYVNNNSVFIKFAFDSTILTCNLSSFCTMGTKMCIIKQQYPALLAIRLLDSVQTYLNWLFVFFFIELELFSQFKQPFGSASKTPY